ncbi:MAG: T9SS type A sorting domain-containing protein [Bacteroidetes bacterium]|nr:T9SS type A sorting domain-containing protein [Bacteroidota bacterium]
MKKCITLFIAISIFCTITSKAQLWRTVGDSLWISNGAYAVIKNFLVSDGELYVVGGFEYAGSQLLNSVATWDSCGWSSLANGVMDGGVFCVEKYEASIIIGGEFHGIDGLTDAKYIARWYNNSWYTLDTIYPYGHITVLEMFQDKVYIAGSFIYIGDNMFGRIAAWDSTGYHNVGNASSNIFALEVYDGSLYAGGSFQTIGGVSVAGIARWDGAQWHDVGGGVNGYINCFTVDTVNNLLYAGGWFTQAGGIPASGIAVWDGQNWSAINPGVNSDVYALCLYKGDLYAGGAFLYAGANQANYIARWDGESWHCMSDCISCNGMDGSVSAFEVYKDELYIGGGYSVAGCISAVGISRWYMPDTVVGVGESQGYWLNNGRLGDIIPNPAGRTTSIPYHIPHGKKGSISISDISGKEMQRYTGLSGQDTIEVNVKDWAKGTYVCSLVVEGKAVGSRKVVVE